MRLGVRLVPLGVPRLDLLDARGLRRETAPQALPAQLAECDRCPLYPTAVFRRRMDRACLREALRLRRIQSFIPRSLGVDFRLSITRHAGAWGAVVVVAGVGGPGAGEARR